MSDSFAHRVELAHEIVDGLFERYDATVSAIVADGWPEAMVRAGLALHRETWDIDALVDALEAELHGFGGTAALDGTVEPAGLSGARRLHGPERVVHIWPMLPGAGVTPVLFGWLLGARQEIRPSKRCTYFALHLFDLFQELSDPTFRSYLEMSSPRDSWREADVVVLSGSDETVSSIHDFLGRPAHRGRPTLIGYGHRVSLAVVDDGETEETMRAARALARDIVLWHQAGCFSPRAVIFRGRAERVEVFGRALGEEIEAVERELDAVELDDEGAARRAQARGVAEFTAEIYGQGTGWVQPTDEPFTGRAIAPHVVSLHHITSLNALADTVAVDPEDLQGAALYTWSSGARRRSWLESLSRLGITRICPPGRLQAPPAYWFHDGFANVLDWMRVTTID